MSSRKYLNNWKLIVITNDQKETIKCFKLDEKQRIIPKLKHQKKRSLTLAQIGFYQNQKLKLEIAKKLKKKKSTQKSDLISSSNQKNDTIEFGANDGYDENVFNWELNLNDFTNDVDYDIFEKSIFDYEKIEQKE